ncbi:hypothetical protein ACFXDP_18045 [Streptomyces sp. NPDC059374]|uniref:hypothetical protein n=1 Tax=Streptomyces sp. NPDC059374 TaxID=3346814 RepID=UPI00368C3AA3
MEQLNFLLEAGRTYSLHVSRSGQSVENDRMVLGNRIFSAVERIALPGSSYIKQLEGAKSLPEPYKFIHIYTVAQGLRDDLVAGWYESMVELVHADTHSDYLEMSEELLSKGYKDPAAVITGTSLEVHVRALCAKHGIDIESPNGTPKKADTMNADLKKAGIYEALQQKQVTAWMDLRNQAAHGNYEKYDDHQVRMFIDGVRAFMLKYPA